MYCPGCGKPDFDGVSCPDCGFRLKEQSGKTDSKAVTYAEVALKLGNYEEAYKYASGELDDDPDSQRAWIIKGVSAANLTDYRDDNAAVAIDCFRNAYRLSGHGPASGRDLSATLHALAMSLIDRASKALEGGGGDRREKEAVYNRFVQKVIAMNLAAHEMDRAGKDVISDIVRLCTYYIGRHADEPFDPERYAGRDERAGPYRDWLRKGDYAAIRDYFLELDRRGPELSAPAVSAQGRAAAPGGATGPVTRAGGYRAAIRDNIFILALAAVSAALVAFSIFHGGRPVVKSGTDVRAATAPAGANAVPREKSRKDVTRFFWKSVRIGMTAVDASGENSSLAFREKEMLRPERVLVSQDGDFTVLADKSGRIFSITDLLHVRNAYGRKEEIIREFIDNYGEPDFHITGETGSDGTGYYYYRWGDPAQMYCEVVIQGDSIKLSIVDAVEDRRNSYS